MRPILILLLSFMLASCAYQIRTYDKKVHPQDNLVEIREPLTKLEVGEKLVYSVRWLGVSSGYITLEVKEITQINNRSAYHIVAQAKPNSFFKFFYDVNYTVDSYIDTETLKSLRFHKERILNGKVTDEKIEFLYPQNQAIWTYSSPPQKKELKLPENPQDLLSSLYYMRLKKVSEDSVSQMGVIYGGSSWPIRIACNKIVEIKISGLGVFKAMLFSPVTDLTTHITGFQGLQAFLSLASKRLPILFKMPTKIGYLVGVLISKN